MPQMGLEVTTGTVSAIHFAVGARVSEGDALLELETDKALTDVVAPHAGVVQAVEVEVGDTVPLGATLVLLATEPADGPVEPDPPVEREVTADPPRAAADPPAEPAVTASALRTRDGRVRAAPVARRAALRLGVDIESVDGTGPRGRVTLGDVERAVATSAANGRGRVEPLSATRAAIARRMTLSQRIPQFALEREVDATWLLEQKEVLARGARINLNDLLLQALAEMLGRHPELAASYEDAESGGPPQLRHRADADLGLAVATVRGLLVPVLRAVHARSLAEIADDRRRLVAAARDGRLAREDMTGGAMTLSNLGNAGIDRFTAMVNPGESAILALGRVVERVVPRGRGLAVIPTLGLTLTVDHRVADGAAGAAALVELAELLEGGMAWRP